jgi:hypothetical protein
MAATLFLTGCSCNEVGGCSGGDGGGPDCRLIPQLQLEILILRHQRILLKLANFRTVTTKENLKVGT